VTDADIVEWREGVRTRLHAAAQTGAEQLCFFEQWCDPGRGAPAHIHPGVEEAIVVLEGEAELWVGERVTALRAGDSIVVPPGARHGFSNTGVGTLRTLALFASPSPPVVYEEEPGVVFEVGSGRGRRRDAHRTAAGD
jgi:quercetin dioxygenase-like cupin family protein